MNVELAHAGPSAATYRTPGIIPSVGPTFHHHRHRNTQTQPSWLNCHAVTLLVIHRSSGGAELIGANYFNRFVFNIMYLERCRYSILQGRSVGPSLWGQIKKWNTVESRLRTNQPESACSCWWVEDNTKIFYFIVLILFPNLKKISSPSCGINLFSLFGWNLFIYFLCNGMAGNFACLSNTCFSLLKKWITHLINIKLFQNHAQVISNSCTSILLIIYWGNSYKLNIYHDYVHVILRKETINCSDQ